MEDDCVEEGCVVPLGVELESVSVEGEGFDVPSPQAESKHADVTLSQPRTLDLQGFC